jgi:hypothetical protein
MLNKTLTYKAMLRITGVICLLISLYTGYGRLFISSENGALFVLDILPFSYFFYFLALSMFPYLAISILFFAFSLPKPRVAYWSLHLFFWLLLLSISTYLQLYGPLVKVVQVNIVSLTLWPWLLIPCLVSLILLVFYKPILKLLAKLLLPHTAREKVKEEPNVMEQFKQRQ